MISDHLTGTEKYVPGLWKIADTCNSRRVKL